MPFRSEAQKKYLEKEKPELAKKFAEDTKKGKKLPQRVEVVYRPRVLKAKKI